MNQPVLDVQNLHKHFQVHAREARIDAIRECSFAVDAGSITALVGPSGAGKSSILKCIYRNYLPSDGCILFRANDKTYDLAQADDHAVLEARDTAMGFVTQFLHCLPRKSALDVVAEPLIQQRVEQSVAHERAAHLLQQLRIPESLWGLAPATFSGGEKQRINIARGFVRNNALLLLDEPTASLDARTAERVVELIQQARAAGTAIVAIWHDPQLVERLADNVVHVAAVSTANA